MMNFCANYARSFVLSLSLSIVASDDCSTERHSALVDGLTSLPRSALAAGFVVATDDRLTTQIEDFFSQIRPCNYSSILDTCIRTLHALRDDLIKYALSEKWAATLSLTEADKMGGAYFRLFELALKSGKTWLTEADLKDSFLLSARLQLHPLVQYLNLLEIDFDARTLSHVFLEAVINQNRLIFEIASQRLRANDVRIALTMRLGRYSPMQLAYLQCHYPPNSCLMLDSFRDYVKRDDERHVRDSLAIYRPATGDSYDYYYDTGGWRRDSRENISNKCDLPNVLVDDLTREKFLSDFVDLSWPFIMRDVGNTWHLKETLRRESLLNEHRDVDLLVGYIPYGEVFGEFNGYATVGEYVDYMDRIAEGNESDNVPLYVFDSGVLESRFVRKNQYSLPDAFDVWRDRDQYHQFILGAPGSGAPFHFHCPAVNVVIYGRKRWFLYPPGLSHYSKIHPQHWLANTYPNAKEGLIECTQHPGDLLFVPSRWSHSVLNVDEVTGIAVEFECNQNQ